MCLIVWKYGNWIVCLSGVESCEFFIYFGDKTLVWGTLAIIFSHTVGSLFILLLFSVAMQKLFILMRSHLFILCFISLSLGVVLVKILLHGISENFLPMFSSKTFMVSRLIFTSLIHPEFIYWRGYFYSMLCPCPLCQILIDYIDMGLFLGSLFCSIGRRVCSYASTRLCCQVLWSLLLCSSFSKLLRLFGVIYCSIFIFEMFVLYLWNMSSVF